MPADATRSVLTWKAESRLSLTCEAVENTRTNLCSCVDDPVEGDVSPRRAVKGLAVLLPLDSLVSLKNTPELEGIAFGYAVITECCNLQSRPHCGKEEHQEHRDGAC